MYDSLQGVFSISDTLANNVHKADKEEVHVACRQVIDLLFCPLSKEKLPTTESTPLVKRFIPGADSAAFEEKIFEEGEAACGKTQDEEDKEKEKMVKEIMGVGKSS